MEEEEKENTLEEKKTRDTEISLGAVVQAPRVTALI